MAVVWVSLPESMSLILPLVYLGVVWARERFPPPLQQVRAGPEVMRAAELSLSLTGCSTQESGPCTLPGQKSRADLVAWGAGQSALRV